MKTQVVYLYHFSRKLGHAGHYLGSCVDLEARDGLHQAGHGARLLQVAKERGIVFWIVRTWRGGRQLERKLKNRHNAARLCPICRAKAAKNSLPADVDFYGMLADLRSGQAQTLATPWVSDEEPIGLAESTQPYLH
jgi:hypothetical protein